MYPKQISSLLKERMTIILEGFDPISAGGFTQVPNIVLESGGLSAGAKITYAMLLRYAWQKDSCYPGQTRLSEDIGCSRRSVITYLKELEKIGYLESIRRGQGKTNVYKLHCKVKQTKQK